MLKGKNELKATLLHTILTSTKDQIKTMTYYELTLMARMIGNSLYDMTPIWSGMKSQALLDAEAANPSTKKCPEHFYPRQVAGWRIIEHIMRYNGISKSKLFEMISVFISVHFTTSAENTKLVPFQKYGVFISPEHSYAQAGITLVQVPTTKVK